MHPTYRILNKPITIFGADRKVITMGAGAVMVVFFISRSIPAALALFACVAYLGRVHAKDATTIPLMLRWRQFKKVYEPKLGQPFIVRFRHDR